MDAVTIGETMALVRTAKAGIPANNSSCTLAIGGAESNVAIGLARLGHKVRWISALGEDSLGELIAGVLRDEGVEVVAARSRKFPTGLMVKSPSTDTQRFVSYYRAGSAASQLSASEVSLESFVGARVLHITGITPALSPGAREMTRRAISLAKQAKLTVSLDLNYRPALWNTQDASTTLRELVQEADIVFGDALEYRLLLGDDDSDEEHLMQAVQKLGPSQVILKLADQGAVALVEGELLKQSAVSVAVVDTVGAGDAFVAGYLSGWLDSESSAESLVRGVICGAQACTNAGDWEGSPTRVELDRIRGELTV